jgi:hypothetical protein
MPRTSLCNGPCAYVHERIVDLVRLRWAMWTGHSMWIWQQREQFLSENGSARSSRNVYIDKVRWSSNVMTPLSSQTFLVSATIACRVSRSYIGSELRGRSVSSMWTFGIRFATRVLSPGIRTAHISRSVFISTRPDNRVPWILPPSPSCKPAPLRQHDSSQTFRGTRQFACHYHESHQSILSLCVCVIVSPFLALPASLYGLCYMPCPSHPLRNLQYLVENDCCSRSFMAAEAVARSVQFARGLNATQVT